jgi:hypothetical protein
LEIGRSKLLNIARRQTAVPDVACRNNDAMPVSGDIEARVTNVQHYSLAAWSRQRRCDDWVIGCEMHGDAEVYDMPQSTQLKQQGRTVTQIVIGRQGAAN